MLQRNGSMQGCSATNPSLLHRVALHDRWQGVGEPWEVPCRSRHQLEIRALHMKRHDYDRWRGAHGGRWITRGPVGYTDRQTGWTDTDSSRLHIPLLRLCWRQGSNWRCEAFAEPWRHPGPRGKHGAAATPFAAAFPGANAPASSRPRGESEMPRLAAASGWAAGANSSTSHQAVQMGQQINGLQPAGLRFQEK